MRNVVALSIIVLLAIVVPTFAGVGDPQVRTDHPWYPGELSPWECKERSNG